ncbi:MAG: tRNA (N6-isopentenyl adenosine(37)-C2)-methylthiotransferase MiaB [Clostridia bacterium]|nr:tRNA (N6-isopentenyl adenosine(37)-C2)-methylthiotransferase MiaB [Clostridia bacterium]
MERFYHIVTYGCQMNVHDSERIAGMLSELGYSETYSIEDADIIVFNTCCIRENAENHFFGNLGALKKLKEKKKGLIIAAGGCLTQQDGMAETVHKKFPFVDIVFGTHNLEKLKDYILQKHDGYKKSIIRIESDTGVIYEGEPLRSSYPNAWVNITFGCNNFCTYCIVPFVKGRERSRKSENILSECESLLKEGYKEITLLGQNVNSYNNGSDDIPFSALLEKIGAMEGKFRLRFMTSHPKDFSEDIARAMAGSDKICNAIHLPVQSGSDRILKAMNRHYTRSDYLRKIDILKKNIPDCAVSTDIIVGFPGETDEDFKDTLSLVREVGYHSAFTFVYSPRNGTPAAKMENQIPEDVKKERIMELVSLVNDKTRKISEEYVGKETEILVEDRDDKRELYFGRDEKGRMGYFESDKNEIGNFVTVKINRANGVSLMGEKV